MQEWLLARSQPEVGALFTMNMGVASEGGGTFTSVESRDDP
jgi:hypothetical protein